MKKCLGLNLCLVWSLSATLTLGATRAPVTNAKGLVASSSPIASEVGAQILRQGGTAADAAVAVGFALAVTWPSAGNIGGGGFALIHADGGPDRFIDYRETAPAAAGPDFYLNAKGELDASASRVGYRASGVPGTVAGLALLHKRWGKLPWKTLLEPARKLAESGFIVDQALAESLQHSQELLEGNAETRKIFFKKGHVIGRGERLIQKDLARSIAALERGPEAFYEGSVGKAIIADIQKNRGVLSAKDLSSYKVVEREPLRRKWRDFEVVTAPPPSSGGAVLLAILGMLEKDNLEAMGSGSADYVHLLTETMKKAFADRSTWFGDPTFVSNPIDKLLDPVYLAKRRSEISMTAAAHDIKPGELPGEKPDTTHFTIRDSHGMTISNTYTLNGSYGTGIVAKGTGILLNNEMDDFTSKIGASNMFGLTQGKRNLIAPGKRPLSSMTPTFVYRGKDLILALGAPGGPTIINSVAQTLLNRLVFHMDIQQAADAPRFHHQWMPDKLLYEPFGLNPDTKKALEARGQIFRDEARTFGDVEALAWDDELRLWTGASDSRNGGAVAAE
ncbi:MAG: gamma-glutamyltransferase [Chitinophagaceae bacterium]|nr:gamma-glutamyltransferase [Oligoflexus sp.]